MSSIFSQTGLASGGSWAGILDGPAAGRGAAGGDVPLSDQGVDLGDALVEIGLNIVDRQALLIVLQSLIQIAGGFAHLTASCPGAI